MAKIILSIEADSPQDLQEALHGLAGPSTYTGIAQEGYRYNTGDDEGGEESADTTNASGSGRRPRRTKAQIAADAQAAAQGNDTSASATSVSSGTQAPAASSPAGSPGPSLYDQVKEANAAVEAQEQGAAADTGAPTKEAVMAVMQRHMAAHSPAKTQEVLNTSVGAKSIGQIDPSRYAEAITALEMEL